MIIPIRCFTCGKVIADKWEYYDKQVKDIENDDTKTDAEINEFRSTLLDKLGLKRMCCKRMMLSHVDIIQHT